MAVFSLLVQSSQESTAVLLLIFSLLLVPLKGIQGAVTMDSAAMAMTNSVRPPLECSSPGWREAPYDTSASVGGYVTFKCRSLLKHSARSWVLNGVEDILSSSIRDRVRLSRHNSSLRFGPIALNDSGVAIGCLLVTCYGVLPSPLGRISVPGSPVYSPERDQIALAGQPFDLDFNYTGSDTPLRIRFTKDRVLIGNTSMQVTSSRLAVSIALSGESSISNSPPSPPPPSHPSPLRLLMRMKQPSRTSALQATSRMESERILRALQRIAGSRNNFTLSRDDINRIYSFSNCSHAYRAVNCFSRSVLKYRTIDGTCNNFFYPLNGAAGVTFRRVLPAVYEDGISQPVGHSQLIAGDFYSAPWPSPRFVSWKIVRDIPPARTGHLTLMFMQWGQFLDHDLDIAPIFEEEECGCNYTERCVPVHVKEDDAVFGLKSQNMAECLPFPRSIPACQCQLRMHSSALSRDQINDITSYIDGSNVYGSDANLANSLRLFKGGLLKQGGRMDSQKGNLPFQEDKPIVGDLPFFVAGDVRANEQTALTVMHTLWMREHNRIARKLSEINPCWSDETLYQEARKIVGAQMQVITYSEFLPLVFGVKIGTYLPAYRGYDPFRDATIPNAFATAAYRFGHSLVRSQLDRLDKNFRRSEIGPLHLSRAFFNPMSYFESGGTDSLTRGLTASSSNPTDEFLTRILTSQLFTESPEKLGGDLASLNIQRGRDHGMASYRTWQRFCERRYPRAAAAQFTNEATVRRLREVYGEEGFQDGIDLWIGGLAERKIRGGQVGPTFACILAAAFTGLRDGDRFWYDNPYTFSDAQRVALKQTSLAKVVCTNADDIPEIQRSVFLAGGQRVSCKEISGVNLMAWRDRKCHYHRIFYNWFQGRK